MAGMQLHHVGYVVQEIGPVAKQYVSRFGYEVATGVIHDPAQTALVQFLRLGGEASYLEFVAPDGPESKLSQSARKGGMLHHLCFMCGPLERELARLEELGMLVIGAPTAAVAFGGRRIAWLFSGDAVLTELVERRFAGDRCVPGVAEPEGKKE